MNTLGEIHRFGVTIMFWAAGCSMLFVQKQLTIHEPQDQKQSIRGGEIIMLTRTVTLTLSSI